ncbi:major facilitator superfamily domain-containing protein [Trichoderma evansii]
MAVDIEKSLSTVETGEDRHSSGRESPILESIRGVRTNRTNRTRSRSRHSATSSRFNNDDYTWNLERAATATVETEIERAAREPITYTRSGASMSSVASRPPEYEVYFEENDPENPLNWSLLYRAWTIGVVSFATWLAVLYSTSYTAFIPGLVEEFGASETVATLGVTTYLLGLAAGSLILAPLSEVYGRQPVYIVCMIAWAILIIPCAIGPSLTTLIVVRFFGALFGAVMISNTPGTVVDISNPEYLSLGISIYSIAPLNGPVLGPLIGGFIFQYKGWRWTNWVSLIIAGATIIAIFTLRETYPPAILKRKAARLRKEKDDPRYWCQYDQKISTLNLLKINMSRPFVLAATEPILWFMNFWISLIYGILYLCFVAYPIVFTQYRGWGYGLSGLSFLGIGCGILIAIAFEPVIRGFINRQPRDPVTGKVLPEAAALMMGLGAILTSIGQLGFSWTCLPTHIHWIAPIMFGIPFGAGNTLCFIYGNNYLAGAYSIYAASALASNAVFRSIVGGTLPLAGAKMYETLSPRWAGTLLGLLEVVCIPIPFVFWRYGGKIRAKSRVIQQLQNELDEMERKRARNDERRARRARREAENAERRASDDLSTDDETDSEDGISERRESVPHSVEEKNEAIATVKDE